MKLLRAPPCPALYVLRESLSLWASFWTNAQCSFSYSSHANKHGFDFTSDSIPKSLNCLTIVKKTSSSYWCLRTLKFQKSDARVVLTVLAKTVNLESFYCWIYLIIFFRRKTEEERQKKEDERARREFIKQEYMRRKQLKLMEDMDTVIKPRSLSIKQKKPRPKSIHRDHIESPKTPIKGPPGNKCSCGKRVCSC